MKRIISIMLAAAMALGLMLPCAYGASGFPDIEDSTVARDAAVLKLMGVVEGYEDGSFRPDNTLTRAQFCKMTVALQNKTDEISKYSTVTVFPDVKPSAWYSDYVNYAAKGAKIIAGYDDGLFRPGAAITSGQAVTILLRVLGYSDEKLGGVWPDSYMNQAKTCGLLDGTGILSGREEITRAQAVRLFVNTLSCKGENGETMYSLSDSCTLNSIDPGAGTITTSEGSYDLAVPSAADDALLGSRGKVILDGDKAVGFLPDSAAEGISDAAVIVAANGSVSGFSDLAGTSSYSIYRSGERISPDQLRKYDVACYNSATNCIELCDTRVSVFYEDCEPGPKSPNTITVLGGTVLPVMSSAKDSLSRFRPGSRMIILLTTDGRVAAAFGPDEGVKSNAMARVSEEGKVDLVLGGRTLTLANSASDESLFDTLCSVKGDTNGGVKLSDPKRGTVVTAHYGIAEVIRTSVDDPDSDRPVTSFSVRLNCEDGSYPGFAPVSSVYDGTPMFIKEYSYAEHALGISNSRTYGDLKKEGTVSGSAFVGNTSVNCGGLTLKLSKDAAWYIADTGQFVTREKALAYSDSLELYSDEGLVQLVVVR